MKPRSPASILITDDQSNIRMLIRTALECEGYQVAEAANGRQALEAIKVKAPDLMVLDLNMPELDGMAVLEQMKSIAADAKPRVIVLTAYGSVPAAVKAMTLGAADFIEKPLSPSQLCETVRLVLSETIATEPEIRPEVQDAYTRAIGQVKKTLRLADATTAEAMLMHVANHRDQQSADYFNLLGVLYETQHKWRLAAKYYKKSLDASSFEPARTNLLRLTELKRTGRSTKGIQLGDESEDILYAQLPQKR